MTYDEVPALQMSKTAQDGKPFAGIDRPSVFFSIAASGP